MNKEKETKGTINTVKTTVKIQAWKFKPIRQNSWKNIPQQFHKMSDGIAKYPLHVIKVNVEDISNIKRIAYVIRKWYGFGTFILLFWNRWHKSSNYNSNFKCLVQRGKQCKFKDNGKCKTWKRHKKGWHCRKNLKHNPNWSKRAKITIYPKETFSDIDYEYKWHKRESKMFYFRKWFWHETRR